jgi:hypothetical protein
MREQQTKIEGSESEMKIDFALKDENAFGKSVKSNSTHIDIIYHRHFHSLRGFSSVFRDEDSKDDEKEGKLMEEN